MTTNSRLQPLLEKALPGIVIATVPLAALLSFAIQPALGKWLLPVYGGTSATWLGCMVYFQLAVLLGYGWAAWLTRQPLRFQTTATIALAAVAVLTFHITRHPGDAPASILRIVTRLSFASLPAMVLLFSVSPLLHGWLRRRGEGVPYYLYAVSNAGSLAAVLLYPFVLEPALRFSDLIFFWHGLLVILAGLLAVAALVLRRQPVAAATHDTASTAPVEPLPVTRLLWWLWLSALTCVGMLGATYHLAAEIGSGPLAWVGPFAAYLLSFTITFSGRWQRWMTMTTIAWLGVSLAGYMVAKGFTAATVNAGTAGWLLSLTAAGSFLGNALVHAARPEQRFERFYLVLAAGGVLGGLFAGCVAPYLFVLPMEFVLSSVALLATGLLWLTGRREPGIAAVVAIVLLAPVVILGRHQAGAAAIDGGQIRHERNLYGHLMLKIDDHSVVLSSDTTTHGTQITTDEAARKHPTLYYTESSGLGVVLKKLQSQRPQMNVGVVGLGAGTLAAYARTGDRYDFWDIDPAAIRIARETFSYLADSAGKVDVVERDGRQALAAATTDYDVIVIDAFTGDGVPPHLLAREALRIYLDRLQQRDGLLVVHASTRYTKLFPIIEATGRTLGRSSLDVVTEITEPAADHDWDPSRTEYVIMCRPERLKAITDWFPLEAEPDRVKRTLSTVHGPYIDSRLIWSDERNAQLDAVELGRFLFGS